MSYLRELEGRVEKIKQEKSVKQSVKQEPKSVKQKQEAFIPFVKAPKSLGEIPAKNIETSGRLIGKRIRGNKVSLLLQLSRYALKTAVELGDVSSRDFREIYDFIINLYKEVV